MTPTPPSQALPPNPAPLIAMLLSLAIIPLNTFTYWLLIDSKRNENFGYFALFTLLALGQLVLGIVALVLGVRHRVKRGGGGVASAVFGTLAALGAVAGWLGGMTLLAVGSGMGGAWGRPLRVRGRQLHPELKAGSDWTRGERPNPEGLDLDTRRALEALWLHDAQKEHASVPAFSRVSWMLAAVGAPAELLEWSHRAALEEIEHTRLCFALAAGYGGRSHSVEPMPDLLLGGLDFSEGERPRSSDRPKAGCEGAASPTRNTGNALIVLATESLGDGCQLEDFNADVAAACALACEEPVTKRVLETIAREERSHAEFSWAVVEWLLERDYATVAPALSKALAGLEAYPRPTAVGLDKRTLVSKADPTALRRNGRLPDAEWAAIWAERLTKTHQRLGIALRAHGGVARAVYEGNSQVGARTDARA